MLWRSKSENPKAVTAFTRSLLRIWLPFSAFWIIGAMLLGVQSIWSTVGPPGLVFLIIGWCAYVPQKPLMAIVIGVLFLAGGYWVYEIRPRFADIYFAMTSPEVYLATASPEVFLQYKSRWVSAAERECKEKFTQRLGLNSATIKINEFCECFTRVNREILSRDDLVFTVKNGELPPEAAAAVQSQLRDKC